jgi:manganese-transporting P-type ATPase
MAPQPLVDNSQIKSAELLSPLPLQWHAYIWPFTLIWPAFLGIYLSAERYEKYIGASEWTFVWIAAIVTLQSLVWLCTHWSVDLQGLFTARKAKTVEDAQVIKVIPIANAGSAEICKLEREQVITLGQTDLGALLWRLTSRGRSTAA